MNISDLQKQLLSYSDFDYPVDVAKAQLYVQTARRILSLGIAEWYHGNERMRFTADNLRSEMIRAEQFIAANSATVGRPEVIHSSLECFRG